MKWYEKLMRVMEVRDHLKNGASLKSLMSMENAFYTELI